jgi:2-polyprenyl-3-methyl-5-hydroxy-6-metoxy-1,4-benzoquinol methylase
MKKPLPSLTGLFDEVKEYYAASPEKVEDQDLWHETNMARDVGRYRDTLEFLAPFCENVKSILDVGGFPGYLSVLYHKYLIDHVDLVSYHTSTQFESFLKEHGIRVFQADLNEKILSEPDAVYDLITLTEVIEHLCDPVSLLVRLKQHLPPHGVLFLSTPNQAHLRARISFSLFGRSCWSYPVGQDICGAGLKGHVREYTREEMSELLALAGYEVIRFEGSSWEVDSRYGSNVLPNFLKRLIPAFLRRGLFVLAKPV